MAGSATCKQSKTLRNCVVLKSQFVYSVYSVEETKRDCLFSLFRHKEMSQWRSSSSDSVILKTKQCTFVHTSLYWHSCSCNNMQLEGYYFYDRVSGWYYVIAHTSDLKQWTVDGHARSDLCMSLRKTGREKMRLAGDVWCCSGNLRTNYTRRSKWMPSLAMNEHGMFQIVFT